MKLSYFIKPLSFPAVLLALLLLTGTASLLQAQIPHYEFLRTTGERTYNEFGFGIATDASGSAFLSGQFVAKIGFDKVKLKNPKGEKNNMDGFVTRYNAFGQVRWSKQLNGSKNEFPREVAIDASGNCYVVGFYTSPSLKVGTLSVTNNGNEDVFLAKFDANGVPLWLRTAGGTGLDSAHAVALDTSGNVYVLGAYQSPSITFGATTLTNFGKIDPNGKKYSDIFLTKYNPNGDVVWATSYGDSSHEEGRDLVLDAAGNIYMCGSFGSDSIMIDTVKLKHAGGIHPFGIPYPDIFLTKLSPTLDVFWAKSVGFTNADVPYGIGIDNSGNAYIAGSFESDSIKFDSLTKFVLQGYKDLYVAKYSNNGEYQWAKHAGGINSDEATAIQVDVDGNSYVSGYFESPSITFGSTTLNNGGTPDGKLFITKYNSNGDVLWVEASKPAQGVERIHDLAINGSGTIYATGGYTNKLLTFDNLTLVNTNQSFGLNDVFVAKLYEATITPSTMFRTFTQANLDVTAANTKKTTANFGNARDTTFLRAYPAIITKGDPNYPGGLVLGVARTDSLNAYGWIRFTLKGVTVQNFLPQVGAARGFDILSGKTFVKELKTPKNTKYDNKLAGELATLKMNISASTHHVTQEGFGDLVFNHPMHASHAFNGKSMFQIADFVDSMLTYHKLFYTGTPTALYDSAAKWLDTINATFSGAFAMSSASPIRITGIKELGDVSFLQQPAAKTRFAIPGYVSSNSVEKFTLNQNYPNPFNPSTVISYSLPAQSVVTLKVYDILGKEVATLLSESMMEQGDYELSFDGAGLATGIYFYKLTGTNIENGTTFNEVKRMMLIK